MNYQGNRFLNDFVLGQSDSQPAAHDFGFLTQCPAGNGPRRALRGSSYDRLASGTIAGTSLTSRSTTSANDNAADGTATDPIAHPGCMSEKASENASHSWIWNVPGDGVTMLGLPKLKVDYDLTGTDATVALKLWDISPAGTKRLVTRGEYRLSTLTGDQPAGTLETELNGNGWRFGCGHRFELQISQTDAPYLRPDNIASSITFSNVHLKLPIRGRYDRTVTAP